MRKLIRKTVCCMAVTACLAGPGPMAAYGARMNMGYLYFGSAEANVRQVDAAGQALNRVSPGYLDLTPDGDLLLKSNIGMLVRAMKERNIKVVPFLSNHWDRELGRNALKNREVLSARIADVVAEYGLDGVNVDIENMTEEDRDAFTDLVRLIREKLPADKELSVAVPANPYGWTRGYQGSFDTTRLAEYSDYLMLMTYDEHWEGSPDPGPVASLPWVEKAVKQALKTVPPGKLALGIPFYGRYWQEGGGVTGSGIWSATAEALAKRYGISPVYDETAQSAVFTFTVAAGEEPPDIGSRKLAPGTYTVWYDNERSIKRKLDLVHKYNLRGTGSWCLGQESPETWLYYASWLNGSYYPDAVGHWAEDQIREAARLGWMTGTGSAAFSPEEPLTRAQAAAVLARALRLAERAAAAPGRASPGGFSDVPSVYWGRAEIGLARRYGLVDGFGDGTFGPDRSVTREQLSAMFFRAIALAGGSGGKGQQPVAASSSSVFSDMTASRWSWEAVAAMQRKGLLEGYPDGTFRPTAAVTRAEAAVLLLRSVAELELPKTAASSE